MQTLNGTMLSFDSDSGTLFTRRRNRIYQWDTFTGQQIQTFPLNTTDIRRHYFNSAGNILALQDNENRISLFNLETEQYNTLNSKSPSESISVLTFNLDGKTIVTGSRTGNISIYDSKTGSHIQSLPKQEYWISALTYSTDGQLFASANGGGTIHVWDTGTWENKYTLTDIDLIDEKIPHNRLNKGITKLFFNHSGSGLVGMSEENTIWLWDIESAKQQRIFAGISQSLKHISLSPDGSTLASSGHSNSINLWDYRTGNIKKILTGHTGSVSSLAYSHEGNILASGSADRTIRFWNTQTWEVEKIIKGFSHSVHSLAFSPDATLLASGGWNGDLRIWDVQTGVQLRTFIGHNSIVFSVLFSNNGKNLVSCERNSSTIKLWDIDTGELINTLIGHTQYITNVKLSPDRKYIASRSGKGIRLWDVRSGDHVKSVDISSGSSLSFSPDGGTIVCGTWEPHADRQYPLNLFSVQTGVKIATLTGHTDHIYDVVYSPDGKTLVSSSQDGTMIKWNVNNITNTSSGGE